LAVRFAGFARAQLPLTTDRDPRGCTLAKTGEWDRGFGNSPTTRLGGPPDPTLLNATNDVTVRRLGFARQGLVTKKFDTTTYCVSTVNFEENSYKAIPLVIQAFEACRSSDANLLLDVSLTLLQPRPIRFHGGGKSPRERVENPRFSTPVPLCRRVFRYRRPLAGIAPQKRKKANRRARNACPIRSDSEVVYHSLSYALTNQKALTGTSFGTPIQLACPSGHACPTF